GFCGCRHRFNGRFNIEALIVGSREIGAVGVEPPAELTDLTKNLDTSGNLLLRGAHGPIGFGFDIAVGLKGLFPLRPWPFEGGFAPVPPSWGHVEAILSSQHHRFML